MKNSELKKLVSEYMKNKQQQTKKHVNSFKLIKRTKELEHRFFMKQEET